jgi:DnaK suppressor protein
MPACARPECAIAREFSAGGRSAERGARRAGRPGLFGGPGGLRHHMRMDENQARALLSARRAESESLLKATQQQGRADREAEDESGDISDPAQPLTAEGIDDALAQSFRDRLAAIERAEQRLASGTYGRSVRSGLPIPDARLEVNPEAELTVEEAAADEARA